MPFSLKYIKKWNALEIKQNGRNTSNVHDHFSDYIKRLPQKHQVDNWTWYIPSTEFNKWMSMFSGITTMTQTEASVRGEEKPIVPEINYRLKHKGKMKLPPYPFQEIGANFLVDKKRGIIGDEMGLGKAQPLRSKLATPNGWRTMGSVSIGDKVYHPSGNAQKVIGVYPQGKEDVYEITFDDGSKTHSSIDHLWNVQSFNDRYKHEGRWRTLSLKEIIEELDGKSDRYRLFIPMTEPVNYPERNYTVSPYVMGYLLGDGHFTNQFSIEVNLHGDDSKDLLERNLPAGASLTPHKGRKQMHQLREVSEDSVFKAIKSYGLHQKEREHYFIPKEYLIGSYEQRLSLLQGLMDSSGHSPGSKVAEYATISEQLSKDVTELVQSVGGRATTFLSYAEYETGFKRKIYRTTIVVPTGVEVFRLERKLKEQPMERKYQYNRSIESIKLIGQEETQCIEVENPDGLYLTDDYIVTHNTMSALTAFNELYHEEKTKKALLIVPASLKYQWEEEVRKFTNFLSIVIDGTKKKRREQYDSFIESMDNFAIISYETMRNDIDIVKDLPFDTVVVELR